MRMALILQCRPFAPELEYSLAPGWGSGNACRVNQWVHACTGDLSITESLCFSNHEAGTDILMYDRLSLCSSRILDWK